MRNKFLKTGCINIIFQLYCVVAFAFTGKDSIAEKYASTITAMELSKHLHIIASDEYEGRETGKKGQKMAAEYLSAQFKNSGLSPVAGNYFQEFQLKIQHPQGVNFILNSKEYKFLKDYYFMRGFGDTTMQISEIVFIGFGIEDDNYSDYSAKNLPDLKGKVVMYLSGEPYNEKKEVSLLTGNKQLSEWSSNWRLKLEKAKEKGAAAVLIISPDIKMSIKTMRHSIETPSMQLDSEAGFGRSVLPNFTISREMADIILSRNNFTSGKLSAKINKKKKTKTLISKADILIGMNRKTEKLSSENVLGFIEGTDLKDEILILTAHYDHLGIRDTVVYNGADDDGSGTVALLELANAFSEAKKDGKGPRRSILIMPVAGEEKGLLGSQYYTDKPLFPLDKTIANLNIDMIGRKDEKHKDNSNYVYLIGADKLSTDLHKISENANSLYTKLDLDYTFNDPADKNRFYYRSDHYNFAKNNIPIIFYFNGVHEDYHKASDEVSKIDFEKIEKITRLVFYTAWDLANRDERIKVDVKNNFK